MRAKIRGVTLIELLIGLAVLSILVTLAVPKFGTSVQRGASETIITSLARSIAAGRAAAVTHQSIVSLCSLQVTTSAPKCRKGPWLSPLTLFTDHNGDSIMNGNDSVVSLQLLPTVPGSLLFRPFPAGRTALQFVPLGFTNNQTGNFLWCSKDKNAKTAHLVIFSNTGRTRLARDRNSDGIREGADGKNLVCP